MRLARACLKRRKIDLSQRSLIHDCIQVVPIIFGVVDSKVLHRGDNTLRLHSINETNGRSRCEIRVFAEVLEVPSIEWRAIDVDTGCKDYPHASRSCIA